MIHPGPGGVEAAPRFKDLAIGQQFRFFPSGSLLTKTGARSYDAPQWGQRDQPANPETVVVPAEPSLAGEAF